MPRLVGAQNPHRKVPRAARGRTHGMRVSQTSQHSSRTRPSATRRPSSRQPRPPLPPAPSPTRLPHHHAGGRKAKRGSGLDFFFFFFFNGREGSRPFLEPGPHKRKRRNDPRPVTASAGAPGACAARGWALRPAMCAAAGSSAAADLRAPGRERGAAVQTPGRLKASLLCVARVPLGWDANRIGGTGRREGGKESNFFLFVFLE